MLGATGFRRFDVQVWLVGGVSGGVGRAALAPVAKLAIIEQLQDVVIHPGRGAHSESLNTVELRQK